MTEAELMQAIQDKRTQLATANNKRQLEDEIAKLEQELAALKPKRPRRTVFLDECAG